MVKLDLNAGFVSWVGRVGAEDALILRILRDAGAIFHVRTTQPQSLMHLETSSNLYGYVWPWARPCARFWLTLWQRNRQPLQYFFNSRWFERWRGCPHCNARLRPRAGE